MECRTSRLVYTLDCRSRREKDPTERMKIEFLMRHHRGGATPRFLERQTAIVEGRKPRYRVPAGTSPSH